MEALTVRGVSKSFAGNKALSEMDLDIRSGEIRALVGENGSGKSTLIKVLSGFHQPDTGGTVQVQGKPLKTGSPSESRRAGLRFVHQDLGLVQGMSALENFGISSGFPRKMGVIDWRAHRGIVRELLGKIGVDIDLARPIEELTAVERTAIAIARCLDTSLQGDATVLVLDEPTAALPQDDVDSLFRIVREVAARGVAVLYVSHRLDEVLDICDTVTAIRDGKLISTVSTRTIDRAALASLIVGHTLKEELKGGRVEPLSAELGLEVTELTTDTIHGLSFTVREGEILGFAGLDGSGREMVARALVGEGGSRVKKVKVGTQTTEALSPRSARDLGLGLVLANRDPASAIRGMSISENITIADLETVSKSGVLKPALELLRASKWIKWLDIRPSEPGRDYGTLSGGNRQKVILAKWLNIGPKVLVMDDPTSGVDVGARALMYKQIRVLADEGVAVVVSSADVEDLTNLCDRVLVFVQGKTLIELAGADITERAITYSMSADQTAEEKAM